MQIKNQELKHQGDRQKNSKSHKIAWFLGAIPLALFALIAWGLTEPYILDQEEETAVVPNLPAAWSGKKVAQLSDFQVGMWWDNVATVSKSVNKLIAEKPEAVFITGDFIYHANPNSQDEINEVVNLLRPLSDTNIPTYAVLGNHDYGMKSKDIEPDREQAALLTQELESIGIEVLSNEVVQIPLQGQPSDLHVVGIGSHWAKSDRVDTALAQLSADSPRITIMHHPDSFIDFPANTASFAMAGHTHGGQIRLPFLPHWSWLSFAKDDQVRSDAWVAQEYGQPGNNLYVNRGVGFSDIPLRINCTPELTFFTLQPSQS